MSDIPQAIADMREALKLHQEWYDYQSNQENQIPHVGDPEWHLRWIKAYENVIEILETLK